MNETVTKLTYESATSVLNHPAIIVYVILIWFIPLTLYLILGFIIKKKSPNGKVFSKPMIYSANFWVAPLVWTIIQGTLLLLLLFPVWLLPFE